jgi:hypothetical protein
MIRLYLTRFRHTSLYDLVQKYEYVPSFYTNVQEAIQYQTGLNPFGQVSLGLLKIEGLCIKSTRGTPYRGDRIQTLTINFHNEENTINVDMRSNQYTSTQGLKDNTLFCLNLDPR